MLSHKEQCQKYNEKRLMMVDKVPGKWALFTKLNEDGTGRVAVFSCFTNAHHYADVHGLTGNLIAFVGNEEYDVLTDAEVALFKQEHADEIGKYFELESEYSESDLKRESKRKRIH